MLYDFQTGFEPPPISLLGEENFTLFKGSTTKILYQTFSSTFGQALFGIHVILYPNLCIAPQQRLVANTTQEYA